MNDEVVREVRAAREAFARAHGYDAYAMVAALQKMNDAGDWPVVSMPPRRPRKAEVGETTPNQTLQQTPGELTLS